MLFLHCFLLGHIWGGMIQERTHKRCFYPLLALQSFCFLNLGWPNSPPRMGYRTPTPLPPSLCLGPCFYPRPSAASIGGEQVRLHKLWWQRLPQFLFSLFVFAFGLESCGGIQSLLLWFLCGPSPNKCLLVLPQSSQGVRSQG